MRHYLDYNATAPVRPEVLAVMQELQGGALNPSSAHAQGRKAKAVMDQARKTLAEALGAFASEIAFTASGTEANNWALKAFREKPVFISAVEHPSVRKAAENATIIPVDANGVISLEALERVLPSEGGFLVSVMLANNETGVLQPIRDIARLVHGKGGLLHCDAVQAFAKVAVDFTDLACDLMTVSAHKMGGPVGAAALLIKNGLALPSLLAGGGQESGRRAGTENVAAIAGFAYSATLTDLDHIRCLRTWLDRFEALAGPDAVAGKSAARLANTSCIAMKQVSAETQLIHFDLDGIAVSAGAACSSGRIEPSPVLKAMGMNDAEAATYIRVSGGWNTQEEDITAFEKSWMLLKQRKAA